MVVWRLSFPFSRSNGEPDLADPAENPAGGSTHARRAYSAFVQASNAAMMPGELLRGEGRPTGTP